MADQAPRGEGLLARMKRVQAEKAKEVAVEAITANPTGLGASTNRLIEGKTGLSVTGILRALAGGEGKK